MSEREKLRTLYQSWSTEELLDIHASGSPTDVAYAVLEDVLNKRGVSIPQRPDKQTNATSPSLGSQYSARVNASRCAQIFAIAGLVLPVLFLIAADQFGINVEILFPFMGTSINPVHI